MPINLNNVQITGGLTFIPEVLTPSGDPYWANVSLLMNNTTTNDQTNNVFLDSSPVNSTISRFGSATQGSFTPFTVAPNTSYSTSTNGGSVYLGSAESSYLTAGAVSTSFTFSTLDFTVECWVYVGAAPGGDVTNDRWVFGSFSYSSPFVCFLTATNNSLALWNGATAFTSTAQVPTNTWTHCAWVRESGNLKFYINGVLSGSYAFTTNYTTGGTAFIGKSNLDSTRFFNGYLASMRVVRGTAVYTGNFTPSTTPLTAISGTSLLLNFTNGGVYDAATKNNLSTVANAKVSNLQSKFGSTSVVFDGSGDYVWTPQTNVNLTLGTGDFTVEFWLYYISAPQGWAAALVLRSNTSGNAAGDSGALYLAAGDASGAQTFSPTVTTGGGSAMPQNTWTHVALTRSGGIMRYFLNGNKIGSDVTNTKNITATRVILGTDNFGISGTLNGYLQDIRITKGVARYTANFTPPTEPFPTF